MYIEQYEDIACDWSIDTLPFTDPKYRNENVLCFHVIGCAIDDHGNWAALRLRDKRDGKEYKLTKCDAGFGFYFRNLC